jgi:hypothetical protein
MNHDMNDPYFIPDTQDDDCDHPEDARAVENGAVLCLRCGYLFDLPQITNDVTGSFIQPELELTYEAWEDDQRAKHVEAGNKKLREQTGKITGVISQMNALGAQPHPMQMLEMRLAHIVDFLMPPLVDDEGNFGNPERIDFEIEWNERVIQSLALMMQQLQRDKITEGVLSSTPLTFPSGPGVNDLFKKGR